MAAAVSKGGGVILAGDPRDLAALADGLVGILIEPNSVVASGLDQPRVAALHVRPQLD